MKYLSKKKTESAQWGQQVFRHQSRRPPPGLRVSEQPRRTGRRSPALLVFPTRRAWSQLRTWDFPEAFPQQKAMAGGAARSPGVPGWGGRPWEVDGDGGARALTAGLAGSGPVGSTQGQVSASSCSRSPGSQLTKFRLAKVPSTVSAASQPEQFPRLRLQTLHLLLKRQKPNTLRRDADIHSHTETQTHKEASAQPGHTSH